MIKEQVFDNFTAMSEYFPVEDVWHTDYGYYNEYNTEQEMRVDMLIQYLGNDDDERFIMRSAEPIDEDEVLEIYYKQFK